MPLFRVIVALVLLLNALNVPLAAQYVARKGLRGDLVGCYQLFTGTGKPVDSTSFYNSSPLVRFDSTLQLVLPAYREFGARRLLFRLDTHGHRLDVIHPRRRLGPMWWADSLSDSVRVSFSNGFSGAFLTLAAVRGRVDTLRGRIEEDWDYRSPTSRGPAYAVRVQCVK